MPSFICEKCGSIENTALGQYWLRGQGHLKDEELDKLALCIECKPKEYIDGSIDKNAGKWHNKFPKRHWSFYGTKEELIMHAKNNIGCINALEYFNKYGDRFNETFEFIINDHKFILYKPEITYEEIVDRAFKHQYFNGNYTVKYEIGSDGVLIAIKPEDVIKFVQGMKIAVVHVKNA